MSLILAASVWVLACSFAFAVGERLEQAVAYLFLVSQVGSLVLVDQSHWLNVQTALMAWDAALMVVLVWVALASRRFWPLWAAGFQIFEVSMHLAFAADRRIRPVAYLTGTEIGSYLCVSALVIGSWTEARAKGEARWRTMMRTRTPGRTRST